MGLTKWEFSLSNQSKSKVVDRSTNNRTTSLKGRPKSTGRYDRRRVMRRAIQDGVKSVVVSSRCTICTGAQIQRVVHLSDRDEGV